MQRSSAVSPGLILLVLCVGVITISTGSILVRLAMNTAGETGVGFSLVIAALRLMFASLILLPNWFKLEWRSLQPKALFYAVTAGVFLAFHFAMWITSLSYTSIAASTTLVNTNPIWVAILSRFWLNERLSKLKMIGILIAFVGGIIIGFGDANSVSFYRNPLLGDALALIGAWAVSLYFMLGREAQQRGFSISGYITIAYTVAALVLFPLPFLFQQGYSRYPDLVYFYLLLMAILPQLIGHTSFNWAVNRISPTLVTLAILFEPMVASFLGYLFFNEMPSLTILLGAIIILIGVAIAIFHSQPPASLIEPESGE